MDSAPAHETEAISAEILTRARDYGADMAGYASVQDLKQAPSVVYSGRRAGENDLARNNSGTETFPGGPVSWPEGARTILVIGVYHPDHKPEMDWWFGASDPPGNRILSKIINKLCTWITEHCRIEVFHLPYHIEKGGIYLKDAAVLAGLGCIGKNNMFIAPRYGPRTRLRALTLDIAFPSTYQKAFDPCSSCEQWCKKACPQQALAKNDPAETVFGSELPGRDGCYSRQLCQMQMEIDEENSQEQVLEDSEEPVRLIKYCRRCELSCPVGGPARVSQL